jgi:hypothetical protein
MRSTKKKTKRKSSPKRLLKRSSRKRSKRSLRKTSRKASAMKKRSKSLTKKRPGKRSGSTNEKRKLTRKSPKVPRGFTKTSPTNERERSKTGKPIVDEPVLEQSTRVQPSGFVYADPSESDQALTEIDQTLTSFAEEFGAHFPKLSFDAKTYPPYADGSVAGQVNISGFEGFDKADWYEFFTTIGGFASWPVAHGQGRDGERNFGGFWFSVEMRFNVPKRKSLKGMDDRYQRYKGAWQTSTYWRRTREANLAIVDVSLWGKKEPASIPELLENSGYSVEHLALRLFWSEDGNRPNWR